MDGSDPFTITIAGELNKVERAAWDALLARPAVVLVCYCTDPARCHRRVLAELLAKLGAVDLGEVERAPAPQMGLAL